MNKELIEILRCIRAVNQTKLKCEFGDSIDCIEYDELHCSNCINNNYASEVIYTNNIFKVQL